MRKTEIFQVFYLWFVWNSFLCEQPPFLILLPLKQPGLNFCPLTFFVRLCPAANTKNLLIIDMSLHRSIGPSTLWLKDTLKHPFTSQKWSWRLGDSCHLKEINRFCPFNPSVLCNITPKHRKPDYCVWCLIFANRLICWRHQIISNSLLCKFWQFFEILQWWQKNLFVLFW